MNTIKPVVIFKFDYFNYMNNPSSNEIELFRSLRVNFKTLAEFTGFMEILVQALTADYGTIKSFYDMEGHPPDDAEDDDIKDDPTSRTIPESELSSIRGLGDFIKVLKRNDKPDAVIEKFLTLQKYSKKLRNYSQVFNNILKIMSSDCMFPIRNKFDYPVLEVEDEMIEQLIHRVRYRNFSKSKYSTPLLCLRDLMTSYTRRKISDAQTVRNYHHKMIGLKGMDDGIILVEESKKRKLDELPKGLSFNFVALPSFSKDYSIAGMRIWDVINSESKVRFMKCLV